MINSFDVAPRLISLFAGRRDVYNTFLHGGYLTLRQPLTPEVIIRAVSEGRPIGAYFLDADSQGHVGAVDFDRPDGLELARRVGTAASKAGVATYAEPSRGGRAHLWLPVEGSLPGFILRNAMRAILVEAGLGAVGDDHLPDQVELRPAMGRLSHPGSLGSALRLPTLAHPATGARYPIIDPATGTPLGRTLGAMLAAIQPTPVARVEALAQRVPLPATQCARTRPCLKVVGSSAIAQFNHTRGISAVLIHDWGVERAAPGRTVRCPAHHDRTPSLSIARDDLRAWCHSPGCLFEAGGRGVDPYDAAGLAPGSNQ